MVSLFLEMREMERTGSTTTLTGKNTIFIHILLYTHNLLNVRFVDRDMLLRYHWGHGVGHVYSHTWTEFSSNVNTVSTSADVDLDLNTGDEAASEDQEEWDSVSNNTGSDGCQDESPKSDFGSDEEDLLSDSESIHPGIDVSEYDDYRY